MFEAYSNEVYFAADKFLAHPQWPLARIFFFFFFFKTLRRWPQRKHDLAKNQIGFLDNKMDNICVILARTSTIFSKITKPIKLWRKNTPNNLKSNQTKTKNQMKAEVAVFQTM